MASLTAQHPTEPDSSTRQMCLDLLYSGMQSGGFTALSIDHLLRHIDPRDSTSHSTRRQTWA